MKGFLLIDKQTGWTSFDVISKLKKITGEKCIGHAGTLDPLATGLLVVALGEGTKLLEFFIGMDKQYEVVGKFGYISDSFDADGVLLEGDSSMEVSLKTIEKAIEENFVGEISQVPPKYSALKVEGKRAYDLAREGKNFELKSRKVQIFRFSVLQYAWPEVRFAVSCGSGTYIRSLIHDLGQILGCGAYVKELRRTGVSVFSVEKALRLEDLEEEKCPVLAGLFSLEEIAGYFSCVELADGDYLELKDGKFLKGKIIPEKAPVMAFYGGKLVGVLEYNFGKTAVKFRKQIF